MEKIRNVEKKKLDGFFIKGDEENGVFCKWNENGILIFNFTNTLLEISFFI